MRNLKAGTRHNGIDGVKNYHEALKNMGLGSGIRKKTIPDPGSRGQKSTGSRIRIRNTAKLAKKFDKREGWSWA
jgi:hypothetical protein